LSFWNNIYSNKYINCIDFLCWYLYFMGRNTLASNSNYSTNILWWFNMFLE